MLKYGIITEIDAAKGLARVHFDEDGIVSDWLPITVPKAMEDSFSFFPDINEHVACVMDEHADNGVIIGSLYNSQTQPNGGNPNKWRVRFKDGTVIEYDRAAHKLYVDAQGQVEIKATGAVKVDGQSTVDVIAQGAVKIETASTVTLKATSVTIDSPMTECTGVLKAASIMTVGGGAMTSSGNITASGDIKTTGGDVENSGGIKLGTHKHTGVQSGGSQTGTPTP